MEASSNRVTVPEVRLIRHPESANGMEGYSQISHHTGAMFSALLDQMTEFTAFMKAFNSVQRAKEQTPTFQD